jgi:nucleotide sugar dehydrogenase
LVVVRSTVIPNTCDFIVKPEIETASGKRCGQDWGLCMNPEFLKEGSAIHDTLHPDRIVIGEFDRKSGAELANLYRRFIRRKVATERMSLVNAELVKYSSNAFLAMKISFANMIANLCETLPTADVQVVTHGMGLDKRVGRGFLNAGLGFGGSCFPKDLKALSAFGHERNVDMPLIRATMEINDKQPPRAVNLGEKLIGGLSGKRVAILGLAFKPETDDMREAVSIHVIRELLSRHANVVVYDPQAIHVARRIFGDTVTYAGSPSECLRGSSLCILATEWPTFSELKAKDFEKLMETPAIVDGRRLLDPSKFAEIRFAAIGLGPRNVQTVSNN